MQLVQIVAPELLENFPALQLEQDDFPVEEVYLPAVQSVHADGPLVVADDDGNVTEYFPFGQYVQEFILGLPVARTYLPLGQKVHN